MTKPTDSIGLRPVRRVSYTLDPGRPRSPTRRAIPRGATRVGRVGVGVAPQRRLIASNGLQLSPPPRRSTDMPARQALRGDSERAVQARPRRRATTIRRGIALTLVIVLAVAGWSYYRALSAPGTDPWTVRSVEWLKNNGMSGPVNWIEHWWYTNNAPPVGGTPKNGLPTAPGPAGSATAPAGNGRTPHLPPPMSMRPLVATPLPNEGVWTATGRQVAGLPAVYTTFFRPDALHTSLVAGALWMDTTLLKTVYVRGLQEPGGGHLWGGQIPSSRRGALVAAFNSGFKISDARGGVFTDGQMVTPLVGGAASLVIDTNGRANVGVWGRDFTMSPNIASVRQNLALIVDNGQPAPGLPSNTNGAWGATLGNKVFVWRSGIGVDRNGGLVYVAGPGLSAVTLAVLLQRAGAIRAMELDINTSWVSAYTYQQTTSSNPADIQGIKLLSDMQRSGDRYLTPGERDFFALFAAR